MKSVSKALLIMTVLTLPSLQMARADAWQEREILTRVREQLIRIDKLLNQAEQAGADNRSRLRMEYPSIRHDLTTIEQGIMQYLSSPMDPASLEPLVGGYTDYQRAGKATVNAGRDEGVGK